MKAEIIADPRRVNKLLSHLLRPEAYEQLKRHAEESEELFLEFVAGCKRELPEVRHHLVHLVRRSAPVTSPLAVNFIFVIYVHKDRLKQAQAFSKQFKSSLKNLNNWDSTTFLPFELERFLSLIPLDLNEEDYEKD